MYCLYYIQFNKNKLSISEEELTNKQENRQTINQTNRQKTTSQKIEKKFDILPKVIYTPNILEYKKTTFKIKNGKG